MFIKINRIFKNSMAAPKRRLSRPKTKTRKKIWKNKANQKALNALNWANLLLKNLQKN